MCPRGQKEEQEHPWVPGESARVWGKAGHREDGAFINACLNRFWVSLGHFPIYQIIVVLLTCNSCHPTCTKHQLHLARMIRKEAASQVQLPAYKCFHVGLTVQKEQTNTAAKVKCWKSFYKAFIGQSIFSLSFFQYNRWDRCFALYLTTQPVSVSFHVSVLSFIAQIEIGANPTPCSRRQSSASIHTVTASKKDRNPADLF